MADILTIIPYEFFPPKYGGALRCFYLLKEMAKAHNVYLLTVQPEADFINAGLKFPVNVTVISIENQPGYRSIFNILPERVSNAINSRLLKKSFFTKGNLFLLKVYPVLKKTLQQKKIDVVNYENLECFGLLRPMVAKLSTHTKHLYDAHNVDSELWRQQSLGADDRESENYALEALALEEKLSITSDLCFCCSENDRLKLNALNNQKLNIHVIANGVDIESRPFDTNIEKHTIKNILFCGTLDYAPNIEAVIWFYNEVFPLIKKAIPQIKFTVIGKLNKPGPFEKLQQDPSVDFIGFVEDVVPYYLSTSILVVPLLSGSGTRLKILEAMSMGSPVVSTSVGAEGLEVSDGVHLLIANEADKFANQVVKLLNSSVLFKDIQLAAYELVKSKYDWKVIGNRMNTYINTLLNQHVLNESRLVG